MKNSLKISNNDLIKKRRKKRRIKRTILFFIFMLCTMITLALKLPYFNIKHIEVINNRYLPKDDIIKNSLLKKGNNIFYVNTKESKSNILKNPYIKGVNINRKLPDKVVIDIEEREALFYNKQNSEYLIFDSSGILLERSTSTKGMKLISLTGLDFDKAEIGKKIPCDDESKLLILSDLKEVIYYNTSKLTITKIDITNLIDLKIYFGDICVKLGNRENIIKKINLAINIIDKNNIKDCKGYVDVSYDGNPVYYIEPDLQNDTYNMGEDS